MACAYDRRQLLKQIQICEFNLTEVTMYLDTHPDCKNALAYYHKHKSMHEELKALYTQNYGPLTLYDNASAECWNWVENPWPWELEA